MTASGLSVVVRLRDGRYDAAGLTPSTVEWPPHPARLFCALVAGAVDDGDRKALAWLEHAGAAEVWSSDEVETSRTSNYVVTNKIGGSGNQTWPGRTNGLSKRVGGLPDDDSYAVVWPHADPDDATLARLVRLAGRVAYVGRSTSTAEVSVTVGVVAPRPAWVCFQPVPLGTAGAVDVRVPYPGYLDALGVAYEDGVRAWQVPSHTLAYAPRRRDVEVSPAPSAVDSPFSDLLVWGVTRPSVSIHGDQALAVADCLRKAVLSRVADPVPTQVCGHGADGRPHVAYLGLVDVGHAHADGHLLGVGVAVPTDMSTGERKTLLRGLLGAAANAPMRELRTRRDRTLGLQYAPAGVWGLRPERWQQPGGSRAWVTATPLMLDRFLKRPGDDAEVADAVAAALVTAGYQQPSQVQPMRVPPVRGGIARLRQDHLQSRPRRPLLHCRVVFDRPQRGPVLAGALRYLGGGMFVPEEVNHAES